MLNSLIIYETMILIGDNIPPKMEDRTYRI